MDRIALRIMAPLSKYAIGKYAGCTVESLLDRDNDYIRWSYFNHSNISYQDEILSKVGILDRYRIAKPGTDPEMYERCKANVMQYVKSKMTENQIMGMASRRKRLQKKAHAKAVKKVDDENNLSKRVLQAINHGHMRRN